MGTKETIPLPDPSSPEPKKGNFLERILNLILGLGAGDPEKDKKRLLKNIAKELKRSKYKFYNPKNRMALPGMAKFFHDIYKVIGSAQALLQNTASSGALRTLFIESGLSKEELKIVESLTEEKIRERAKTTDLKTLVDQVKEQIVNLYALFDNEKIKRVNKSYGALHRFIRFVSFDYYFLLKKFDHNYAEKDFNYVPKFESINGDYVTEDLKDFLEILLPLELDYPWDELFDLLKNFRNVEVVSRPAWKKLVSLLDEVRKSGVLEQIICHLEDNPFYKPVMDMSTERIVEPYLTKIKTQTELLIQKLAQERKNQQIDQLVQKVFGSGAILRMRNYTEKANLTFSKKMLGGYTLIEPANYLKAFMLDYVKKDIRELRDLLIVRGKWATNLLSQQLSESFHALVDLSDELVKLDDACGDEGEYGVKIRKVINRVERDQGALKIVRDTIRFINERMARIINESGRQLVAFGKNLKNLIDDYDKTPQSEIIINWKEVDQAAEGKVREQMVEIYKKVYTFIQLLQLFVKEETKG